MDFLVFLSIRSNFAGRKFRTNGNQNLKDMIQQTKTCQRTDFIANLYEQCYEQLKSYFVAYCHDVMSAEDMVQNLFLKIMSLNVINEEKARSLVFSTAHNMIVDDVRHRAHIHKARLYMQRFSETTSIPNVYDKMDEEKMLEIEATYIGSLPKKRANIYRLWRTDTMTAKKIAADMNLSVRTVEHHIYLATKGMKEFFQKAM